MTCKQSSLIHSEFLTIVMQVNTGDMIFYCFWRACGYLQGQSSSYSWIRDNTVRLIRDSA